jgi:hypothetical protein
MFQRRVPTLKFKDYVFEEQQEEAKEHQAA